jgi:hypothetical protein
MSKALFLRLLPYDDKSIVLAKVIELSHAGNTLNSIVHVVDPISFSQIPGSPFAYWVSEHLRGLFTELPAFESEGRTVKQGLATADDFRFVRLWWEVKPQNTVSGTSKTQPVQFHQQTFFDKRWVPLTKGGTYSPYYSDLQLVVNWGKDGEEIRNFDRAFIRNESFYFYAGLTWPSRPHKRGAFSHVPTGAIFSHTGTMLFLPARAHWATSALLNSDAYIGLLHLLMARGGTQSGQTLKYEIGYIASVPIPNFNEGTAQKLSQLAIESYDLTRTLSTAKETSHLFHLPALLQVSGEMLTNRISAWHNRLDQIKQHLAEYQYEINDIAFRLYRIEGEDRRALEVSLKNEKQEVEDKTEEAEFEDEDSIAEAKTGDRDLIAALLSYALGCSFERWDVRFAIAEKPVLQLPGPFDPYPICSPGMLTGNDGLPLRTTPPSYPLQLEESDILVDDSESPNDVVCTVRGMLGNIWKDRIEPIEQEACQILGIKDLREYFRRPNHDGFWMDHVKRYSKSRRKAPIYWLLQSAKRNYALWLYYHRLDKDTLFKALTNYVEPKIRLEDSRLEQIRTQLTHSGTEGREAKQLERQLERQESLVAELYDFRDKFRRAAYLGLEPDLNDGVVLNIAPLWELVPWSEAKRYWGELVAGKYGWSSISKQLRGKGVI